MPALFLSALVVILALSTQHARAAQQHEAKLYHTLGADETLYGRLQAREQGDIAIAPAPSASASSASSVASALRELIEAGKPYSLRLSTRLGVPEGERARHVVASVPAACAAQLLLPPLPPAKGKGVRGAASSPLGAQLLLHVSAAGAPVALEVEAVGGDGDSGGTGALACDRSAALRQLEHFSSSSADADGAALPELRVRIVSPSVAPPVTLTTQAPGQQQQQAQQQQAQQVGGNGTGGGGNGTTRGGPPPKDERTFLQKNGLFIVGGAMMALNVLLRPDPAPARGGGGGGGGRPVQRRQG